ncbi:MAG: sulfur carrier protein ThiS [Sporomusaceae bacterium]|nr:sulfur carrier protein ThiS [Sporomusaceae bacterium]
MQVILNGSMEMLEGEVTLSEFLLIKGMNPDTVIIELNGKIIKKTEWSHVVLSDKDCLEVLKFVGGG